MDNLKYDFYKLIKEYPKAHLLIDKLLDKGEILLFGGAVRNYMESRFKNLPRDFDIVLNKKDKNTDIEGCFFDFQYKKNRYDGYKVIVDGLKFDIWEMENTWAFRHKKVPIDEANLTETVFLNIDSIVYNINNENIYDHKYKECMEKRELDIVLEDNPFVELNLLRAIIFKKKYELFFSEKLRSYLLECKNRESSTFEYKLYEIQISHYGAEYLSEKEIKEEVSKIILE